MKTRLSSRRLLRPEVIATVVALTFFALLTWARHAELMQRLELQTYDVMVRMRHVPQKQGANITIIGIDEEDIRALDYPLSDKALAGLLRKILTEEPRAIGLDLFRDLPEPRDGTQLAELEAVMRPAENLVTIFLPTQEGRPASGVSAPAVLKTLPEEEWVERVTINDFPIDDSTVRRAYLFLHPREEGHPARTYNSFALRLAMLDLPFEAQARGVPVPDVDFSPESARIGKAAFLRFRANDGGYFHADAGGFQFLLDYRGRTRFPQWPLRDVLAGRVPPAAFRDRVVLIGNVASSFKDTTGTPLEAPDTQCPGTALHAQVIDQIIRAALDGDQPTRGLPGRFHAAWTLLWALLGSASALTLLRWPRGALAGIGVGLVVLVAIKHWAFQQGWWLPLVEPGLAYVLSAGVSLLVVFVWERRQRGELMQLFSRHVSTKVADDIWEHRDTFLEGSRPKPQELTATVLFTDLVGFSSVSEKIDAATLMAWLNEGMERLAAHVETHGGIVNKYIGDAIMAVFGVPIPRTTPAEIAADAAGAIRCALAMSAELHLLNAEWRARGWPEIGMRIGIHTGPLVAGSLGAKSRLEFTVIGDTVNTASRLESSGKDEILPPPGSVCRILIGHSTFELTSELFESEPVGSIPLKGKSRPLEVYRVSREREVKAERLQSSSSSSS
ncbi:MAG TPA: adenylate/guanylate cyclase domain-containing protein [Chthoniobacteraceae bacterium]|jgi:adenylate cyclase|nr:adenylate/guanylate cyclase domain-containing protein [Chthoniobacteraceae bacterium]